MALVLINESDLVAIGDAIRNKTNTDDTFTISEMSNIVGGFPEANAPSTPWGVNITQSAHQTIYVNASLPQKSNKTSSFTLGTAADIPTITTRVTPDAGYIQGSVIKTRSGYTFNISANPASLKPTDNSQLGIYFSVDNNSYDYGDEIPVTITLINNTTNYNMMCINFGHSGFESNFNWDYSADNLCGTVLGPGDSYVLTGTYTITDDAIVGDHFMVINVEANLLDISTEETVDTVENTVSYTYNIASPNPQFEVMLEDDTSVTHSVGDWVALNVSVTNTGNLTLTNISAWSELLCSAGNWDSIGDILEPGSDLSSQIMGSEGYQYTQEDFNRGYKDIDVIVEASTDDPDNPIIDYTETIRVTLNS